MESRKTSLMQMSLRCDSGESIHSALDSSRAITGRTIATIRSV